MFLFESSVHLRYKVAELLRVRSMLSGVPWVIKFGYLCNLHPRNFGSDKIVGPYVCMSNPSCQWMCNVMLTSLESIAYKIYVQLDIIHPCYDQLTAVIIC